MKLWREKKNPSLWPTVYLSIYFFLSFFPVSFAFSFVSFSYYLLWVSLSHDFFLSFASFCGYFFNNVFLSFVPLKISSKITLFIAFMSFFHFLFYVCNSLDECRAKSRAPLLHGICGVVYGVSCSVWTRNRVVLSCRIQCESALRVPFQGEFFCFTKLS